MPTKQPASEVVMNRPNLTLLAGTPMARAASLLPPTAKIQLPYLVRNSTNEATAVATSHHSTEIRKFSPVKNSRTKKPIATSPAPA